MVKYALPLNSEAISTKLCKGTFGLKGHTLHFVQTLRPPFRYKKYPLQSSSRHYRGTDHPSILKGSANPKSITSPSRPNATVLTDGTKIYKNTSPIVYCLQSRILPPLLLLRAFNFQPVSDFAETAIF